MTITAKKITEKACVGAELGHFQLSKKAEAISPNLNSRKCPISAPRQAFSVIFFGCDSLFDSALQLGGV